MAEKNKLAQIPSQQMPERQSNLLSQLWDEATGAFARYGRRSGAQRDASLALLNQAVDPNTDPLTGAGMKALGLAGLITHPLAFFPTREEWDQRLEAADNTGRMSRSIGGFLSDLPSLIDPQMAAGGTALAAAPLIGKIAGKADDVAKFDESRVVYRGLTKPYDPSYKSYYQTFTSSLDDAQEYGPHVVAAHLRPGKNLSLSAGGNNFNAVPIGELPPEVASLIRSGGGKFATTDEIAHAARQAGYDSITVRDVHDSRWGERSTTREPTTIDMVFDQSNIAPIKTDLPPREQKKVKLTDADLELLSELFK